MKGRSLYIHIYRVTRKSEFEMAFLFSPNRYRNQRPVAAPVPPPRPALVIYTLETPIPLTSTLV